MSALLSASRPAYFTSPTTPTISTVRHASVSSMRSLCPIALGPGKWRRASVRLTRATGTDDAESPSSTSRPARTGALNVRK
jgi:hypothetical protein